MESGQNVSQEGTIFLHRKRVKEYSMDRTYLSRELRWLSFNERLLLTAENHSIPLMERLKFIGIFSSNLDEFYSTKVGALNKMIVDAEHHPSPPNVKPRSLVKHIEKEVRRMSLRVDTVLLSIFDEMREQNIHIVDENSLSDEQYAYVHTYFEEKVRSSLFPILLDSHIPFPYLKHITVYLAVDMYSTERDEHRYALIKLPADTSPRYIPISCTDGGKYFIMLDDMIRLHLHEIFHIFDYDTYSAYTIKITRDGEYDISEEITKSIYEKISASIKQRSRGLPIRFVYDRKIPQPFLDLLMEKGDFDSAPIILSGGKYHNARDLLGFPKIAMDSLYFPEQKPLPHPDLVSDSPLIPQVENKDILLSVPYHSFDYLVDLLREAALDSRTHTIYMTLYRVTERSRVINALINAARNGKKVVIFIEIQASFDEAVNISWADKLSREPNVTLISSMEGMKVHSKIGTIVYKDGRNKKYISFIGTGNFNESTARIYTDNILLTSDKQTSKDLIQVFELLERGFAIPSFRNLIVSPFTTRKKFIALIKKEIQAVREGGKGEITLKLNNLVDGAMIRQLLRAAKEGVKVQLLIRGICTLDTDTEGLPPGMITGTALIDRYLEHSRIYRFYNNGNPLHFIGSADWMERNLDNRIEVITPILDKGIAGELDTIIEELQKDNHSSFHLESDMYNQPVERRDGDHHRAQKALYKYFKGRLTSDS